MITPKEKAKQLLDKALGANYSMEREKEAARFCQAKNIVEEVLVALKENYSPDKEMASNNSGMNNSYLKFEDTFISNYWNQVRYFIDNYYVLK